MSGETAKSANHPVPDPALRPIDQLIYVMAVLRGPGGCPWDREQSHKTLTPYAVEEVYELIEAVNLDDDTAISDELGDLLLQVVFHAQMASERGAFDFDVICRGITEKLVRRHPHVFATAVAATADDVVSQWDAIKRVEKANRSRLPAPWDSIPLELPALLQAQKYLKKTGQVGEEKGPVAPAELVAELLDVVRRCAAHGLSAEELLRDEMLRRRQAAAAGT